MEWDKGGVLGELYNYFDKKHYDEERSDEEIAVFNQEIFNTLDIEKPFEDSGTVTVDGIDYIIIHDEEEAERIAIERAKNDLESDPGMFNQEWLQSFIYINECDKNVMISEEEYSIRDMVIDNISQENMDFENEEEKEQYIDDAVEDRIQEFAEGLEDPLNYFVHEQGMFLTEELIKQSWICIDFEEAAKEAIVVDGWPHFLSLYDGSYEETENGLIIFRDC